MRTLAQLVVALSLVTSLAACGSSGQRSGAPAWLHRLATKQARIFSEGHASRVSRVKPTVGTKDAIELWGRFACNGTNCAIGSCDGLAVPESRSDGTCVISFRYIKLGVDSTTHRLGLVKKLRGARAAWVAPRSSA